ncbi:AMP-binding protein [Kordiimonas pumila]|uniref:AMP-binding protein n=1 Tax=Kordiimonas pumila TaxID=2161677 RepID=A0ABV7D585_9PROT|nr:AMP-binding protein [Kordiimonas pumila]
MQIQQHSYVCGTSSVPLKYQTIGAMLDETVAHHGQRLGLIVKHQNIRWTYAELASVVEKTASGLIALGLNAGDRVGIWAPNCVEWVIIQLASAKAGLILVTLNPAYRASELEYALNKSGCRALVLAERFKSSDYTSMLLKIAPEISDAKPGALKAQKLPQLEFAISISSNPKPGFMSFDQIAEKATVQSDALLHERAAMLQPDDAVNIQFTSGTTGFPKGATLTHHNIVNNGFFVAERQRLTQEDILCIPVPLYHCFGMVMGVMGCITHGACMVFPGEAFTPESVLEAVHTEHCTGLYGVPTMFIAELDHPDFKNYDLSSLRTGVMAGSPCPVEIMKRVIGDMHMAEVTICYGMTETSPVSLQSTTTDSIEKRVSTVGQVHPYVEVKIIDADGHTVKRGEQGELCTRGYSVMLGYWGDDSRTREAIDTAGWMHTGDLAVMDTEGYVNITGRVKDMIIRGGENIYPREIEEFLYSHPAVQDVQVFGVPDEKYGEEVSCWIIPKPGAALQPEAVIAYCKDQIAHYKVPRHIRIVEAFPMTVTGKIQKFVMRETMKEELGVKEQKSA